LLQVFSVDDSSPEEVKPRITPVQSLSTLPEDFKELNYVSEIKIDKEGRFVYISNRGHNSIAVYAVDQTDGSLTLSSIDSTLGKTPRHFGLAPCGKYAVVGDQDSDSIKIFSVCPRTGSLNYTGVEYDMASPNFVLFQLPHPVSVHLPEKESVEVPMAMGSALAVSAC
jgi:6-phosphogluconolactonase